MTVPALTVTSTAFDILIEDLESHGNKPGHAHRAALLELVDTMTEYAHGKAYGRRAFGLPTGCGKTSAIIAWITAIHRLGLEDIAVSVAASQVEALCGIKRQLIEHGVPEQLIGLKHSQDGIASEPSTGREDRRFQFVTHARVRAGNDDELLLDHKGSKRKVMIYDETLFRSDSSSVPMHEVSVALAGFSVHAGSLGAAYDGVTAYLIQCQQIIAGSLENLKRNPANTSSHVIDLPPLDSIKYAGYRAQLEQLIVPGVNTAPLCSLLELSQNRLRLMATQQRDGVIWYEVSIPNDLKDVIVLDASYHIRKLVHFDDSISLGWSFRDYDVKRYDNVTVHQLLASGSRTAITESFKQNERQDRHISREIVDVVKSRGASSGILIFTFKKREIDVEKRLLDDLKAAGVDTGEVLPNGRKRINLLTWGSETSLNDFAHCDVVIMVGVMQRSHLDIASMIVGQQDDLTAQVDNKMIKNMVQSEVAHLIYQGASRGSCRIIDNGQAKPMQLYVIHKDICIRDELGQVMKGATWKVWKPRYASTIPTSVTDSLALQIHQYLSDLSETTEKVSSKSIKDGLKLDPVDEAVKRAFSRAMRIVAERGDGWVQDGRSMIRAASLFK